MSQLDDGALKSRIQEFKAELADKPWEEQKNRLDAILPEVFAIVREAMRRTLGQRHFDVQVLGGIVLHRGEIAEMKTGEGKTQTATLPVVLNALAGRGVHVVTPNDYLSRVGGGWTGPIYDFLGLTTSVLAHETAAVYDPEYETEEKHGDDERLRHWRPVRRKEAYQADITYTTNNELGFDYLRDNMAPSLERMVQRDLHYAIVDEIDSILIDEARTPLIISAPASESGEQYAQFANLVRQLQEGEHYTVDEKQKAASLTEEGLNKMEKLLGVDNIYTEGGIREVHHIEQALKAWTLFKRDRDYVIKDGEIIIVDEFTGRLMPGRRYSEGLHQAIEAKEGVEVKRESMTLATITFQNYFRMYEKLSGMTGTAMTEAEEFHKIYGLEVVAVPTNRPNIRNDRNDLIYRTEEGKYQALVRDIKEKHEAGQPVLVGTISIEKNELLADMLQRSGVPAEVLNAKNHEREAHIIAQAGQPGAVTIATNMAGRGVDIILGGSPPDPETAQQVKDRGGLYVIGTERHESRRIDNQLRGRAGRQGDPGETRFYLSMEDDLMRVFGGDRMKRIMTTLNVPEDMPIENKIVSRSIESAQKKVEAHNFDIRKHLVEYDDVINRHREATYRRRREVLEIAENRHEEGKTLRDIIEGLIAEEVDLYVRNHTASETPKEWDLNGIKDATATIMSELPEDFYATVEGMVTNAKDLEAARSAIVDYILTHTKHAYDDMAETIQGLSEAMAEDEPAQPRMSLPDIEKQVLIRAIDQLWTEHIDVMDHMRRGISLRSYGQRDPLVEYKKEGYRLFHQLNDLIRKQVVYSIFKVGDVSKFVAPTILQRAQQFIAPDKSAGSFSNLKSSASDGETTVSVSAQPAKEYSKNTDGTKVGRNDPCPCGSGKKYKKCHGV